jgi:ribonuclease VapC
MTVVLDASALLAYLLDEPGSEIVDQVLADCVMSAVNWSEVVQKIKKVEVNVDAVSAELLALGLRIEPFLPEDGYLTGLLAKQTSQFGLSLGDRACLSLGLRLNVAVLTADTIWSNLNLSLKRKNLSEQGEPTNRLLQIQLIRQ